ncbi:MAG: ATP-dependent DNA ligase [Planctomycetota bacterium]
MRRFADLYEQIDRTTSTDAKVDAIVGYLRIAPRADAAWAIYLLSGEKIKRLVPSGLLRAWCEAEVGIESWLFDVSYAHVGDLAETIALLIDAAPREADPPGSDAPAQERSHDQPLHVWIEGRLLQIRGIDVAEQERLVRSWMRDLPRDECFLLIKILTGALRVGVSRTLVERAVARHTGLPQAIIAHRFMGDWRPTAEAADRLLSPTTEADTTESQPYPFFLASPVVPAELPAEFRGTETDWVEKELGQPSAWLCDWKFDGIRAQVIKRGRSVFIWSRGDENMTERFPEVVAAASRLPGGTVLDGELLCFDADADKPAPFALFQRRIGRKSLGPKILQEAPATLIVYDLLEANGRDLRGIPIEERRTALGAILTPLPDGGAERRATSLRSAVSEALRISSAFRAETWAEAEAERATARDRAVEGLMLKRIGSTYQAGRRRGDWWKWKIEPLTIDAVLTYAQPGHGRRANLLTDYTFALWDGSSPGQGELVTVAKAYSGLADAEFTELDAWIRKHTTERFGPVRAVEPFHVFELAFEGVHASPRHKSGVAFRFPRMKRWRRDKPMQQADTLATVRSMIGLHADP